MNSYLHTQAKQAQRQNQWIQTISNVGNNVQDHVKNHVESHDRQT